MTTEDKYGFDTRAVHAGQRPGRGHRGPVVLELTGQAHALAWLALVEGVVATLVDPKDRLSVTDFAVRASGMPSTPCAGDANALEPSGSPRHGLMYDRRKSVAASGQGITCPPTIWPACSRRIAPMR